VRVPVKWQLIPSSPQSARVLQKDRQTTLTASVAIARIGNASNDSIKCTVHGKNKNTLLL